MNNSKTLHSLLAVRSFSVDKRGLTLIEVLVSVSLIAIAVMGVVSLQVASLSSEINAVKMDSCSFISRTALDRIVANKQDVDAYIQIITKQTSTSGATAAGNDINILADLISAFDLENINIAKEPYQPTGGTRIIATTSWKTKGNTRSCFATTIL